MAFETYTDLKEKIRRYLSRGDLTVHIPDFIRLAEIRIQRELKLRAFETFATGTLTAGSPTLALPADCLEPRSLRVNTTPPRTITVSSPTELARLDPGTINGAPLSAISEGLNLYLAPTPDAAYAYRLIYQKRITPLAAGSNETNWLTQNAADLLLYGSLLESAPYIFNDERIPIWQGFYDRAEAMLKAQDWRARAGTGPIEVRPDVPMP